MFALKDVPLNIRAKFSDGQAGLNVMRTSYLNMTKLLSSY